MVEVTSVSQAMVRRIQASSHRRTAVGFEGQTARDFLHRSGRNAVPSSIGESLMSLDRTVDRAAELLQDPRPSQAIWFRGLQVVKLFAPHHPVFAPG